VIELRSKGDWRRRDDAVVFTHPQTPKAERAMHVGLADETLALSFAPQSKIVSMRVREQLVCCRTLNSLFGPRLGHPFTDRTE
jgi:hypothetical protein